VGREVGVKEKDINHLWEAMEQFALFAKDHMEELGDEVRSFAAHLEKFVRDPLSHDIFSLQKNVVFGVEEDISSHDDTADGLPYKLWLSEGVDLITGEYPYGWGATLENKLEYVKEKQGTIKFLAYTNTHGIYGAENLLHAFKTFKELKGNSSNTNELWRGFSGTIGEKDGDDPVGKGSYTLFDLMYLLVNGKNLPKASMFVSPEVKANIDQLAAMDDPAGKELSDLFNKKTIIICQRNEKAADAGERPQK
jgi:hypothetical protein